MGETQCNSDMNTTQHNNEKKTINKFIGNCLLQESERVKRTKKKCWQEILSQTTKKTLQWLKSRASYFPFYPSLSISRHFRFRCDCNQQRLTHTHTHTPLDCATFIQFHSFMNAFCRLNWSDTLQQQKKHDSKYPRNHHHLVFAHFSDPLRHSGFCLCTFLHLAFMTIIEMR